MRTSPDSHDRLLALLLESRDWVSSRTICSALACSRTAVWKQVETLRGRGYGIEARPRLGYRLVDRPDIPCPEEVRPRLTTAVLGRPLVWLPTVDSTNRWLTEKAEAGAPEGCVVTADEQTAGRGRLDRAWFSPPGLNLYVSLLLRPPVPLDRAASLALVLGLGVRRALQSLAPGLDPRLKWPNDIWIGGRKVAGILCDMRAEPDRVRHVVAGLGLNLNLDADRIPPDLRATATSLRLASGRPFSRADALAALLNQIEPLYRLWVREGLAPLRRELEEADLLRGREVSLAQAGRTLAGRAAGLAPDGALVLDTPQGPVAVYSGDVTLRSIEGLRP